MNIHGNYNTLISIEQDIRQSKQTSPAFAFLMGEKIKRFYSLNSLRLKAFNENIGALLNKYVQKDADGKFKMDNEDGNFKDWVYNNQDDETKFKSEYTKFMETSFTISC